MKRLARALVFVAVLGMPGAAGAVEMKPYMAMYKAAVKGAPSGLKGEGQFILSVMQRCKIWDFRQTMNLTFEANGRAAMVMVMSQEGEESIDGKTLTSKATMAVNGKQTQATDKGTTAGLGKAGKVEVEQDGARRMVEIPDGSYFFAGASNKMLAELEAGKKAFTVKLYDPIFTHAVNEQNYTVVPSPFFDTALPADPGNLLKGKSWVVKLASVAPNGQPSETFIQVHDSGITSRILQNVGGAQVEFVLQSLQGFPKIGC